MPSPTLALCSKIARLLGTGALENRRARDDVLLRDRVVVDWDLCATVSIPCRQTLRSTAYLDIGVAVLAVPRNGSLLRSIGRGGARAGDGELRALGVKLRRVGLMEGDQLVADEVVARGKPLGDSAGPGLVTADEFGDIPARRRLGVEEDLGAVAVEAGLVDLEPPRPGAVAGAEGAGALVHPHDDGSLAVCPLAPDGGDAVARCHGGVEGCRGAAVAAELGGAAGCGRVVVRPLPLDHVLGVRGREALISVFCISAWHHERVVHLVLTLDSPCQRSCSW